MEVHLNQPSLSTNSLGMDAIDVQLRLSVRPGTPGPVPVDTKQVVKNHQILKGTTSVMRDYVQGAQTESTLQELKPQRIYDTMEFTSTSPRGGSSAVTTVISHTKSENVAPKGLAKPIVNLDKTLNRVKYPWNENKPKMKHTKIEWKSQEPQKAEFELSDFNTIIPAFKPFQPKLRGAGQQQQSVSQQRGNSSTGERGDFVDISPLKSPIRAKSSPTFKSSQNITFCAHERDDKIQSNKKWEKDEERDDEEEINNGLFLKIEANLKPTRGSSSRRMRSEQRLSPSLKSPGSPHSIYTNNSFNSNASSMNTSISQADSRFSRPSSVSRSSFLLLGEGPHGRFPKQNSHQELIKRGVESGQIYRPQLKDYTLGGLQYRSLRKEKEEELQAFNSSRQLFYQSGTFSPKNNHSSSRSESRVQSPLVQSSPSSPGSSATTDLLTTIDHPTVMTIATTPSFQSRIVSVEELHSISPHILAHHISKARIDEQQQQQQQQQQPLDDNQVVGEPPDQNKAITNDGNTRMAENNRSPSSPPPALVKPVYASQGYTASKFFENPDSFGPHASAYRFIHSWKQENNIYTPVRQKKWSTISLSTQNGQVYHRNQTSGGSRRSSIDSHQDERGGGYD